MHISSNGEKFKNKDVKSTQNNLEVPVVYWLSSQEMDTAIRVQILDETRLHFT